MCTVERSNDCMIMTTVFCGGVGGYNYLGVPSCCYVDLNVHCLQ